MDGKKIICFHGFGTSGEFMKHQMATWIEKFPKTTFVHLNGLTPFRSLFTMDTDIINFHGDDKPVWDNFSSYSIDRMYPKDYHLEPLTAPNPELQRLAAVICELNGVDGILGFSQGTILAEMLVFGLESGLLDGLVPRALRPYFLLMACPHSGINNPRLLRMPALVMAGSFDRITPASFMMLLRYKHSSITAFEGGHRVPFLTSRLQREVSEFVQTADKNKARYFAEDPLSQKL